MSSGSIGVQQMRRCLSDCSRIANVKLLYRG
jgi:hypothetical protein